MDRPGVLPAMVVIRLAMFLWTTVLVGNFCDSTKSGLIFSNRVFAAHPQHRDELGTGDQISRDG